MVKNKSWIAWKAGVWTRAASAIARLHFNSTHHYMPRKWSQEFIFIIDFTASQKQSYKSKL